MTPGSLQRHIRLSRRRCAVFTAAALVEAVAFGVTLAAGQLAAAVLGAVAAAGCAVAAVLHALTVRQLKRGRQS